MCGAPIESLSHTFCKTSRWTQVAACDQVLDSGKVRQVRMRSPIVHHENPVNFSGLLVQSFYTPTHV